MRKVRGAPYRLRLESHRWMVAEGLIPPSKAEWLPSHAAPQLS